MKVKRISWKIATIGIAAGLFLAGTCGLYLQPSAFTIQEDGEIIIDRPQNTVFTGAYAACCYGWKGDTDSATGQLRLRLGTNVYDDKYVTLEGSEYREVAVPDVGCTSLPTEYYWVKSVVTVDGTVMLSRALNTFDFSHRAALPVSFSVVDGTIGPEEKEVWYDIDPDARYAYISAGLAGELKQTIFFLDAVGPDSQMTVRFDNVIITVGFPSWHRIVVSATRTLTCSKHSTNYNGYANIAIAFTDASLTNDQIPTYPAFPG